MVLWLSYEKNAANGDLFSTKNPVFKETAVEGANARGKVIDLVFQLLS